MRVNLGQLEHFLAELARNPERMDDLLHNSACSSDSDILVAAWAVLVQLQPVLNAPLAEKLVAVIAFFGFSADLEAYLAQDEPREFFADFEATNAIRVVAHRSIHFTLRR